MGWFLIATGFMIAVPVIMQLRAKEQTLREVAGFLIFAAGLLLTGTAREFVEGAARDRLTYAGVLVVVIGLIVSRTGWKVTPRND